MRVLFCMEQDGAAQARQRAQTPAQGLVLLGHHVDCSSVSWYPTESAELPFIRGQTKSRMITQPADVVVLRLVDQDESAAIRRARAAGQVVIFDWDDDVWHLPPWSPARPWIQRSGRFVYGTPPLREYTAKEQVRKIDLDLLETNMRACDAVIASTPELGDTVRQVLEEAVPVYVCRNGVDARRYRWPRRPPEHSPLRLGWLGTVPYLGPSLATIVGALWQIFEEHPDRLELWHLGHSPEEPAIEEVVGFDFPGPIRRLPWVPAAQLGESLREIDLAVVPRLPCAFTRAQSNMTGLSLAAAGVPYVVSPTPEYEHLAELRCGLTAARAEEWVRALGYLLTHDDLRHHLRQTGRDVALERYSPKATAAQYIRVFALVGRQRSGGMRGHRPA